ncbi:MAG: VOC family protein [Porticoccaceae bacterium]|nr:VOC family protein [Porticoccaceae bacterium]
MRYLHSMVRVTDLQKSLDFYCKGLGLVEMYRNEYSQGRFTLVFLGAPDDMDKAMETKAPLLELTYNWEPEDGSEPEQYTEGRNFGHLAYRVENIYKTCQRLADAGVVINRPPRDGHMAFVRSPDNISIEILQENGSLEPCEPWLSMPNTGKW